MITKLKVGREICVASNGERGNVIKSLQVTKLFDHFGEDKIFTKIQVERPKPAPDLFLFACDQMKTRPEHAFVIEDSAAGVAAACAANIPVIGFVGTAHNKAGQEKALRAAGAEIVIDALIHIEKHITRR